MSESSWMNRSSIVFTAMGMYLVPWELGECGTTQRDRARDEKSRDRSALHVNPPGGVAGRRCPGERKAPIEGACGLCDRLSAAGCPGPAAGRPGPAGHPAAGRLGLAGHLAAGPAGCPAAGHPALARAAGLGPATPG